MGRTGARVAGIVVTMLCLGALSMSPSAATHDVAQRSDEANCNEAQPVPKRVRATSQTTLRTPAKPIRLKAGARRTIEATVALPAGSPRVDMYFVVDNSGSMGDVICGLRLGMARIASDLWRRGTNAQFGLAIYADDGSTPAYKRLVEVSPLGKRLMYALYNLDANGGGVEPGLTALYQSASGKGQDAPPEGRSMTDIPKGQDAKFRDESLRVIVMATDEVFNSQTANPTWRQTLKALNDENIKVLGLSVGGAPDADLERVARATDAMTPTVGIDCDGDGDEDLDWGDPMVCKIDRDVNLPVRIGSSDVPLDLAPAIIAMLRALKDPGDVTLRVTGGRRIRVDRVEVANDVDLNKAHTLDLSFRVQCPSQGSRTERLTVDALSKGRPVASAPITVRCVAPPAPGVVFIPARGAAAPGPAPQPAQQPQGQPQNNPQPSGAGAFSVSEQADLAFEHAADDELEMSSNRGEVPPIVWGAVAVMMGAAAYGLSRREQVVPARATRR